MEKLYLYWSDVLGSKDTGDDTNWQQITQMLKKTEKSMNKDINDSDQINTYPPIKNIKSWATHRNHTKNDILTGWIGMEGRLFPLITPISMKKPKTHLAMP